MQTFLFVLTIFATIWLSTILIAKLIKNERIPALNIIAFAAAWTALITHSIGLWG